MGGEIFRTRSDPLLPASYIMDTGSFQGVKRPGRGVDHPLRLASRFKEEWSYTSAPPLDLRGLF